MENVEAINAPKTTSSTNVYLVLVMGVVMMDFMSTFFSLSLFWQLLGGTIKTYGVVLGVYPLARALCAPFVGFISKKIGMRWVFFLCLFSMLVGNALYLFSSTYLASGDEIRNMYEDYESGGYPGSLPSSSGGMILLISARVLVGMGSSCVSLVTTAIVHSGHTEEQKHSATTKTRIAGLVGSTMGNLMVILCLNLIHNTYGDGFMLNGFTIPVLFTMFCEALLLGGASFFAPPLDEAEDFVGLYRVEPKENFKQSLLLNIFAMLSSLVTFLYFAQLVPIASLYYHVIHSTRQFWKAFSPSVIGLIIALVLCKRMIKCGSSNFTLMKSGCIIGVIGCILLFGWGDMEWSGDQGLSWLYYIGGSFYFMGAGMLTTGCRNCLSRVIERSEYVSTLMCKLFISSGIGCFLGSALSSLFLYTLPSDSSECELGHGSLATTFECIQLHGVDGLVAFCLCMFCVTFTGVCSYHYLHNKMGWDTMEEEYIVIIGD